MKINLKLINKVSAILLFFTIFNSCGDSDNVILDIKEGFLQVEKTAENVSEGNADGVKVNFLLGATSNENGITVKYSVDSDDNTRFEDPNNGIVDIPAGKFNAEITISPINNLSTDGDIDVIVTLTSDNILPVGIAGGINNVSKKIKIIDDDCPIDINSFVGTYSVNENFTSGGNSPRGLKDFFNESYQLELSLDPNDTSGTKLIVNNSAGFNTYIRNGTVLAFDTCNNNVTFDNESKVEVATFEVFPFTESSYDEEKFIIKCEGAYRGEYQFTLTKI